jgi:hypothetical protein
MLRGVSMHDATCPACQAAAQSEIGIRRRPNFVFGPSGIVPWVRQKWVPFRWGFRYLRTRGPVFVLRKTFSLVAGAVQAKVSKAKARTWKTPTIEGVTLDLKPGEWVQVKTLEEIHATVDSNGKTHGLFFTNEMKLHCGKRYRVFKRVDSMFNEFTQEQRKVKNTVLLDAVHCRGEGLGCDRSCFHMWREAWQRRVPEPQQEIVSPFSDPRLPILNPPADHRS